jgi:hypothetical protein
MIRFLEPQDIPRLKEMQGDFEWTYEPDYLFGMVVVDEKNRPVMAAGAWKRAEVHMLTDHTWATPLARAGALIELHNAMGNVLARDGVAEVITWLDDMRRFQRRLKRLGWDAAKKTMWCRRLF